MGPTLAMSVTGGLVSDPLLPGVLLSLWES